MHRTTRAANALLGALLLAAAAPHYARGGVGEPATGPAGARATSQPAVSDAALNTALEAAQSTLFGPALDEILRSVASRFSSVTVSTEPGNPVWNKLTLNGPGKRIDAIRFRVPDGEPRDLLWAMISNELRYEWHICTVDGEPMRGFSRNWYYKPDAILGARTPKGAKDLMLQTLPASSLRPGAEYLIWFKFRHEKPRPTYVALGLLAAADPATIDAPEQVVRALSLSPYGDPIDAIATDVTPTIRPASRPRPRKK